MAHLKDSTEKCQIEKAPFRSIDFMFFFYHFLFNNLSL